MVAVASLSVREGDLLALDEPTRDFDPRWQAQFRGMDAPAGRPSWRSATIEMRTAFFPFPGA